MGDVVEGGGGKIGIWGGRVVIVWVEVCDIEEEVFVSEFVGGFDRNF